MKVLVCFIKIQIKQQNSTKTTLYKTFPSIKRLFSVEQKALNHDSVKEKFAPACFCDVWVYP